MPKHHKYKPIIKSKNVLNVKETTTISKASENPNRPIGTPTAKRNITSMVAPTYDSQRYILNDVKYSALVGGFIIILLVILYFIFR